MNTSNTSNYQNECKRCKMKGVILSNGYCLRCDKVLFG
jgi:hypothetical protein